MFLGQILGIEKSAHFALGHAQTRPLATDSYRLPLTMPISNNRLEMEVLFLWRLDRFVKLTEMIRGIPFKHFPPSFAINFS
jgi:hypothetical protein